jgi:hypothetical protein
VYRRQQFLDCRRDAQCHAESRYGSAEAGVCCTCTDDNASSGVGWLLFSLFCFIIAGYAFFAAFIAVQIWLAATLLLGSARAGTSGRRSGPASWLFASRTTSAAIAGSTCLNCFGSSMLSRPAHARSSWISLRAGQGGSGAEGGGRRGHEHGCWGTPLAVRPARNV